MLAAKRIGIAVVLLSGTGLAEAAGWWRSAWTCRRQIEVPKFSSVGLPGEEIGVVEMPTAGAIQPDGGDIRVTTYSGTEIPCRVLMIGPGDRVRLAFALHRGVTKYYVYFGCEAARPAKTKLDLRRGVLLETWQFPGGRFQTFEHVKQILGQTKVFIGRKLLDRCFLGHNPFGPQSAVVSVITGWLIATETGKYDFACSSQNASFLLIDEELVIANGGRHGPTREAKPMGSAKLTAGLHKLTVYHVSDRGDPVIFVAWRKPGDRYLQPIPPAAYAPFHRATPGPIEQVGRSFTIDFLPEHAGETFLANRYYQGYAFKAIAHGRTPKTIQWHWDFGDGQTSDQPAVDHVYLVPGEYKVTLTAKSASGDVPPRTNRVYVSRPWDKVTINRVESVRRYARIVLEYDFEALRPEPAIAEAVLLLNRGGTVNALVRAGDAFLKLEKASGRHVSEILPLYVESLRTLGEVDKAIQGLQKAATMTDSPGVCADMLVQAGSLTLNEKGDPDASLALFQKALADYEAVSTGPAIRNAKIGIGDVWRMRGDYERAAKAYAAAKVGDFRREGKDPFVKGDFARHVEAYIRTRAFTDAKTYLDQWAETFPLDKLEGYWSLLYVRWAQAGGLHKQALHEVESLVRVHPASNYAAELLWLAADSHRRAGSPEDARKALQRIVEKYPESPFAAMAAEKLRAK